MEPKWEDPECANGGKWTVTSSKRGNLDTMWLETVRKPYPSLLATESVIKRPWTGQLFDSVWKATFACKDNEITLLSMITRFLSHPHSETQSYMFWTMYSYHFLYDHTHTHIYFEGVVGGGHFSLLNTSHVNKLPLLSVN